jgi:energy-coupling factor transporter ATP-binding protein EcfA2
VAADSLAWVLVMEKDSPVKWNFDSVVINDGFLDGLSLPLNPGLTCVIGPRGSGKSTLATALRYAIAGLDNAPKSRLDLFKANLGQSVVTVIARRDDGTVFTVRREGRNPAVLTTAQGSALSSIDLDRGTFLPLDAYSAGEIETIANEDLGPRRRALLDELRSSELRSILDDLASEKRELDANADALRATERETHALAEQILSLAEAPALLAALPPATTAAPEAQAMQVGARQAQLNEAEAQALRAATSSIEQLGARCEDLRALFRNLLGTPLANPASINAAIISKADGIRADLLKAGEAEVATLIVEIERSEAKLAVVAVEIEKLHLQQAADYAKLRQANESLGQAAKERARLEQDVSKLKAMEAVLVEKKKRQEELLAFRRSLRARYMKIGERISDLRCSVADALQQDSGPNVRIAVRRSADKSEYLLRLTEGLKGAGVSRHESIVDAVARLRPDELAVVMTTRNYAELESISGLDGERGRRVLDAFRMAMDPFELDTMRPDDMVSIELNVGSKGSELYRDAAKLSQGQKCTALLPLLLARRRVPLIIDQPEDNLDNHFIYETVVSSIRQMKDQRQMIFVTHNANIPVLAEADLVVVLTSDGSRGRVEKIGSLDECREEIVDLLEGGEEAFELRRQRYRRS